MNIILLAKEKEQRLKRTMSGGVVKLRATFVYIGILMHLWVILVTVEGWTYHEHDKKMTWNDSREWCQKHYTDIVMVHDENVTDFMKKHLQTKTASPYYWIGIKKINGSWIWVPNGQITKYENWANNEPNNHNSDENCVEMYLSSSSNNGKWNDDKCSNEKYPVCQKAQCPNSLCTDNMVCEEQVNNFTCVCKPGFFGPQCKTVQNKHFVVSDEQPLPSSSCQFSCVAGYKLSASAELKCSSSGFWNKPPPSFVECFPCVWFGVGLMNCTEGPDNSSSVCTVQCPPAHLLLGFAEFTCRADGTWELYFPPMCASYVHFLIALIPSLAILLFCGCLFCCSSCRKTEHAMRSRTLQETENPVYEAELPPPLEGPLCSA